VPPKRKKKKKVSSQRKTIKEGQEAARIEAREEGGGKKNPKKQEKRQRPGSAEGKKMTFSKGRGEQMKEQPLKSARPQIKSETTQIVTQVGK